MKEKIFSLYLFLISLTAIIGGMGLIVTNGMGMSLSLLKSTPFKSYLIPGFILALVVGGINLIAAYFQLKRKFKANTLSIAAGFCYFFAR